jgi:hypothetical protein
MRDGSVLQYEGGPLSISEWELFAVRRGIPTDTSYTGNLYMAWVAIHEQAGTWPPQDQTFDEFRADIYEFGQPEELPDPPTPAAHTAT